MSDRYHQKHRHTLIARHGLRLFVALMCVCIGTPYPTLYGEPAQPPPSFHTPSPDSIHYLESFDYPEQVDNFPANWDGKQSGWRNASWPEVYYRVREEEGGNLYLAAETRDAAIDAGRKADINLRIYNKVRWRWRVWDLPEGGNEENKNTNDSGAAVRLVFYGGLRPRMLKYVWSSTLPAGTRTESAGNSKIKVIVLQSGPERTGEWVWEEVNAYDDYKTLFGGEPRPVRFLGVISDANNTKSQAKADYDDFSFIMIPSDTTDADTTLDVTPTDDSDE